MLAKYRAALPFRAALLPYFWQFFSAPAAGFFNISTSFLNVSAHFAILNFYYCTFSEVSIVPPPDPMDILTQQLDAAAAAASGSEAPPVPSASSDVEQPSSTQWSQLLYFQIISPIISTGINYIIVDDNYVIFESLSDMLSLLPVTYIRIALVERTDERFLRSWVVTKWLCLLFSTSLVNPTQPDSLPVPHLSSPRQ